jgi:hypothetical protein
MPDDSNIVRQSDVFVLEDMAELAARLGSPMTYDRYGNFVWGCDFAHGLSEWVVSSTASSYTAELSNYSWLTKGVSCYLSADDASGAETKIARALSPVTSGPLGLSAALSLVNEFTGFYIGMELFVHNIVYHAYVKYVSAEGKLYYLDETNAWVVLGTPGVLYYTPTMFHNTKLVYDLAENDYVGFSLNGQWYSLADVPLYIHAFESAPFLAVFIAVTSPAGLSGSMYVDNVIVTQNERP